MCGGGAYLCVCAFNIPVHDDENGDAETRPTNCIYILWVCGVNGRCGPVKDDRKKKPYDV